MSLTWCAMRKENLSAFFVVFPVCRTHILNRFCKFQNLFTHKADSVIRNVFKNNSISFLRKFVSYNESALRALQMLKVSSVSVINVAYTRKITGRI